MPESSPRDPDLPDLAALLTSWQIILSSENKSPTTITTYTAAVRQFLRWCGETNGPPNSPATLCRHTPRNSSRAAPRPRRRASGRHRCGSSRSGSPRRTNCRRPLAGLKPPKIAAKVVEALTDDQLKQTDQGVSGQELRDRRDEAIVRLMAETGLRAGEVVALAVTEST